ncbi:hypothetical protein L950_0202960 [Sphingobacterium sp. IITKGP-BTPF85]|nr:hypothetical protein L950_0202960 [Sphingobacterium sp. IITKGP-BTPF85]
MLKKISGYFVLLLISTGSYAQNFDSQKLDSYFASLEQNNKFMGSVAISKMVHLFIPNRLAFLILRTIRKQPQILSIELVPFQKHLLLFWF